MIFNTFSSPCFLESDYGTIMSAEGKPLLSNFERLERIDVKKPGPAVGSNQYNSYKNYDEWQGYNPDYDHNKFQPNMGQFDYYHYPTNDMYVDHADVDIVGGENENGAITSDGSYVLDAGNMHGHGPERVQYHDENGNEINIGHSTGHGGMVSVILHN